MSASSSDSGRRRDSASRKAPAPPAVAVERLSVAFGGLRAVDDVTFDVPAGQRRAIIGPNGAGKTTLFNLIGGQLRPITGVVRLFGDDVTHRRVHQRARAGLARTFQITNLLTELSVWDNVLLAVAARHAPVRRLFWNALSRLDSVTGPAAELLRTWGLWTVRDHRVSELAYGQQRVLEIVLALAAQPRILLLDEPTAGLSKEEAGRMTEVAAALPGELTLLIIEHDMEVAFALADVVQVMAEGVVLATGAPAEIQRNDEVIAAYLGGARGDA